MCVRAFIIGFEQGRPTFMDICDAITSVACILDILPMGSSIFMRCQAIGVTQVFGGVFVRSDRRDPFDEPRFGDCSK